MRALILPTLVALVFATPALAKVVLPGFESPSRNIRCFVTPGPAILHCSIGHADYAQRLVRYCGSPPIGVDWGGFELGATRKGTISCTGGVLYNPATQLLPTRVLAYGTTWRSGAFSCDSRVTGITCRSRSGHGLFISRASWRAW